MLPEFRLQTDVDLAAVSPLIRAMMHSLAFAEEKGGIGLTATEPKNRNSVSWEP